MRLYTHTHTHTSNFREQLKGRLLCPKIKENKGITLTVLVITIIILLILVGITIYTGGNNSIVEKAKQDRDRREQAMQNAQGELDELANKLKEEYIIVENITASSPEWDSTTHTASITLSTTTDLQIQWQKNGTDGIWTTVEKGTKSTTISNLNHNDRIYARLYNGVNAGNEKYIQIKDGTAPTVTLSVTGKTSNSISVSAQATDNEWGMPTKPTYSYYIKEDNGSWSSTANYTGENASYTFTGLKADTFYWMKVVTSDKAGNKGTNNEDGQRNVTKSAPATDLELNSVRARIATGYTRWLTATATPSSVSQEFEWTSSNTNVATVDSTGKITAKAVGTTNVTVKTKDGSNLSKTCQVTVANGVDVTTLTSVQSSNKVAKDSYGNLITVPGGFKVLTSEATNATQGIVIQDNEGNEFVWVPVDSVSKGASVRADDIRLGRYTFTINGTPTKKQDADNYTETVTIYSYYQELTSDSENTAAKNLGDFVTKTQANGGYYLGRYEASYKDDTHCYSKKSTLLRKSSDETLISGMLWDIITQANAAMVARNSFNSNYVESDLINSYSWDTAIVFIQEYSGNNNYANQSSMNTSLANTGENNDKVCNIYDMASNCDEWSTEHSTNHYKDSWSHPCVTRGGCYSTADYQKNFVDSRHDYAAYYNAFHIAFRSILYIK